VLLELKIFGRESLCENPAPKNTKSAARRLRFLVSLLLHLFYQVGWGKVAKIRTLFLLANVRVTGKVEDLGA